MKNTEKELIKIVKYLPIILIFFIISIITFFLYTEIINRFDEENRKLKEEHIRLNKELIKFHVSSIKDNLLEERKKSLVNLKKELKEYVLAAYSITKSLYENNKEEKTKEEIQKLIKEALRNIRFNENRGYFFIYGMDGNTIFHPIKPEIENKNLWDYQDKKGTYLLREMSKILKTKTSTYYSWFWTKPNDKKTEYEKIGFFKLFEPYNWYIGAGEYVDDYQMSLKKKLANRISKYRYNKDGYIFIIDDKGNYISYYDKKIIGKNIKDLNLSSYTKLSHNFFDLVKEEGSYIEYKHKDKPTNRKKEISKISYVDKVEQWGWLIGTGFYMDDFYEQLAKKEKELNQSNNLTLKKLLITVSLILLFITAIFFYLSSVLDKKFLKYKERIKLQIKENIEKDNLLSHQSRFAVMGEMLANISHQWRQPLSTISTILSGLKMEKDLGMNTKESEERGFSSIKKNLDYLSETINDFTNFFKPSLSQKDYEISDVIDKSIDLLKTQLEIKRIELIKNVNNHSLYGSSNQLVQVLINILNNAKDELEKIEDKKIIFISTEYDTEYMKIIIKDNAGGIQYNFLDRIFEPYFSTKDNLKGTGIGLYMSKQIVEKNFHGKIIVKNIEYEYSSKKYIGAEFTIIFPIEENLKNI